MSVSAKKILFVDDEPNLLSAFQRQLRKQFDVDIAVGPEAGLAVLENPEPYGVVVADMRMPVMNGVEFLAKVKQSAPNIVRIMLTGNADQGTAIEAINEGNIFRFLNKPCPPEKLTDALNAALRQHQLITAEHELLESTLRGSVKVLTEILAMAEPKSFGHAEALRLQIRQLATVMGVQPVWELEVAAMLSHIGAVVIPPEVVLKARIGHALSPKEQEMFARVPAVGGSLISQIPRLEEVSKIVTYQNKRFDGTGYPDDNVAGPAIPIGARMLKVLCDLAELESRGTSRSAAFAKLQERTGWYDPEVMDSVAMCFQLAPQQPVDPGRPTMQVTVATLRIGHVLRKPAQTKDDILIVPAGTLITPALIQRLRNFSSVGGVREPLEVEDSWDTRQFTKTPA